MLMGPTGSGKGTLTRHALSLHPDIYIPVSATTRAPRPGEVDGREYTFLTKEQFEDKIAHGYFLEHAVYGGNYYGTPKTEVLPHLEAGELIVLEIEVQGVRQLRDLIPSEERLIVYIDAGSWESMEARIRSRAPITDEEVAKRRKNFEDEDTFKSEADVIINNRDGKMEEAKKEFADLIESLMKA